MVALDVDVGARGRLLLTGFTCRRPGGDEDVGGHRADVAAGGRPAAQLGAQRGLGGIGRPLAGGLGAERLAHADRQRQDRGELAQGGPGDDVGLVAVVGKRVHDGPGLVQALQVGGRQGRARADRPVAELALEAQVGGLVVLLVALGVDEGGRRDGHGLLVAGPHGGRGRHRHRLLAGTGHRADGAAGAGDDRAVGVGEGGQVGAPRVPGQVGDGGAGDEGGHGPGGQADDDVVAGGLGARADLGLVGAGAGQAGREGLIDVRADRHRLLLGAHAQQWDALLPAAARHLLGAGRGVGGLDEDGEGVPAAGGAVEPHLGQGGLQGGDHLSGQLGVPHDGDPGGGQAAGGVLPGVVDAGGVAQAGEQPGQLGRRVSGGGLGVALLDDAAGPQQGDGLEGGLGADAGDLADLVEGAGAVAGLEQGAHVLAGEGAAQDLALAGAVDDPAGLLGPGAQAQAHHRLAGDTELQVAAGGAADVAGAHDGTRIVPGHLRPPPHVARARGPRARAGRRGAPRSGPSRSRSGRRPRSASRW